MSCYWEYKVVSARVSSGCAEPVGDVWLEKQLDDLGESRWELVSIRWKIDTPSKKEMWISSFRAVFKRQK